MASSNPTDNKTASSILRNNKMASPSPRSLLDLPNEILFMIVEQHVLSSLEHVAAYVTFYGWTADYRWEKLWQELPLARTNRFFKQIVWKRVDAILRLGVSEWMRETRTPSLPESQYLPTWEEMEVRVVAKKSWNPHCPVCDAPRLISAGARCRCVLERAGKDN